MRKNVATLCFLVLLSASAFGKSKLEGVWQTVEVKTLAGPKPGTFTKEPGVLIFTEKHYSMIIPLSDTRTQIDQGKGTAEEWRDLWGPFIANSGTYEISGEALTTRPTVAKNPGVVKAAPAKHSFHVDGDTLTITSPTLNVTLKRLE